MNIPVGTSAENLRDEGVLSLGSGTTKYPTEYDASVLERFKNQNVGSDDFVGMDCFEFSSLCPMTRQPDIGNIHIAYIPNEWMVESKSLKLYLFSFRNHGAFHEWCVRTIRDDLVAILQPKYLEVYGDFNSRGGISILPVSIYATEEYQDLKKTRQAQLMQLMASRKH